MQAINKLVICGVGLIGGSLALAARRAGVARQIVGIGRSIESLTHALELGVIDALAGTWKSALDGADMVVVCTPVGQMDAVFEAMAPYLGVNTIVTDAGSTKTDVIEAAWRHLDDHRARLVPAHPIAGAEKSGVDAAHADLFVKRKVVLTPLNESSPAAVARVRELWQACGAQVSEMSPAEHDKVFAAVSHLPHLLAYGLVHDLAVRDNAEQLFGFAAGGFRDFTRIAASHPEMWRDICIANRQALLGEVDRYLEELTEMRAILLSGDAARLEQRFVTARNARIKWADGIEKQEKPA